MWPRFLSLSDVPTYIWHVVKTLGKRLIEIVILPVTAPLCGLRRIRYVVPSIARSAVLGATMMAAGAVAVDGGIEVFLSVFSIVIPKANEPYLCTRGSWVWENQKGLAVAALAGYMFLDPIAGLGADYLPWLIAGMVIRGGQKLVEHIYARGYGRPAVVAPPAVIAAARVTAQGAKQKAIREASHKLLNRTLELRVVKPSPDEDAATRQEIQGFDFRQTRLQWLLQKVRQKPSTADQETQLVKEMRELMLIKMYLTSSQIGFRLALCRRLRLPQGGFFNKDNTWTDVWALDTPATPRRGLSVDVRGRWQSTSAENQLKAIELTRAILLGCAYVAPPRAPPQTLYTFITPIRNKEVFHKVLDRTPQLMRLHHIGMAFDANVHQGNAV
jgi:hypothetical protein